MWCLVGVVFMLWGERSVSVYNSMTILCSITRACHGAYLLIRRNHDNLARDLQISEQNNYCTSTKFHYLFNFTIFTNPEDALYLICMKYYEMYHKFHRHKNKFA